ncbi:EamA family transporter [Umezawaea sp. Da 62-37]|uniref:EamA family transporter n=1 Tax=Umezawaea sp. Da 62-37 TaxID=3075927 RepID=UPI0028F72D11|nr:EamA family transporter [Umezawaea sp. Da 62-37]WNV88192.1 EamA family transporter [Umezawaea sp. Da 62-37]
MTASLRVPSTGPAVLMVLGSCLSLQFGTVLAAHLFPVTGALGATVLRLALAATALLAISRPRVRRWTRAQWLAVLPLGLGLAGMNGFFYAAIERIPLGTTVTIEFLGPLALAAVLSRRPRDLGWILLAATGVAALGWSGDGGSTAGLDPLGVVFALCAAVFWAVYVLAGARTAAVVPGHGGLAVAMGVAAVAVLPGGAVGAGQVFAQPHLLLFALGTALLASVVPHSLQLSALRALPRPVFGVLLSLEPAVATLTGWLLLSQDAGPVTAAAVTVVVLASVGSTLSAAPKRDRQQEGAARDDEQAERDDVERPVDPAVHVEVFQVVDQVQRAEHQPGHAHEADRERVGRSQ